MEFKTCTKCGKTFPVTTEYFSRWCRSKDGLRAYCKICGTQYSREYYRAHKEERAIANRIHYENDKNHHISQTRAWNEKHKEHRTIYNQAYRETHKEHAATANRAWREVHKEETIARARVWYTTHKEEIAIRNHENRARIAKRERQRIQVNPMFRLDKILRSAIWKSLRGHKGGRHWETLVGYALFTLICHLESLFQPGMSWDNYGKYGWHIDHIRPIASFSFASPDDSQFKECWALSNLQPLWAKDNLSKSKRWDENWEVAI